MSRYIDADALIEDLHNTTFIEGEDRSICYSRIQMQPTAQPEQTIIKEIREWINSENRGSADYFIVDKIEEVINKYE